VVDNSSTFKIYVLNSCIIVWILNVREGPVNTAFSGSYRRWRSSGVVCSGKKNENLDPSLALRMTNWMCLVILSGTE
jgi:hypothetical protein